MKMRKTKATGDLPWGSNEWCTFCGARPGQTSDATGKLVTAIYACPQCMRNYCDQCADTLRGLDDARCLRCDSEMELVAQQAVGGDSAKAAVGLH